MEGIIIIIVNTYCCYYCIAYPFNFNALVIIDNFTIYYIHRFNYYHSSYIKVTTTINFITIMVIIKEIVTIIISCCYYYSCIVVNYYVIVDYNYYFTFNSSYVTNFIKNTAHHPYSNTINFN